MMTMKICPCLLLVLLMQSSGIAGKPIAPTTLDGATPIDAQVSAADFGALDAFAEDAAESESSKTETAAASQSGFKISLLPTPEKTAESVNLEHEAIPSKVLSVYDNSQKKLTDVVQPVPILDSISEHEKYGNNGDMFDGISRTIVNGYEAFSNLLNTFIQTFVYLYDRCLAFYCTIERFTRSPEVTINVPLMQLAVCSRERGKKPKELARSVSKGITAQLDIIGGKLVGL